MSAPNDAPALLRRCAEVIGRPGGWMQGAFRNNEGTCFCAAGIMIELEADADDKEQSMWDAFVVAILPGSGFYTIARWNDAPERTQADVVAAFLRAAEIAEARP